MNRHIDMRDLAKEYLGKIKILCHNEFKIKIPRPYPLNNEANIMYYERLLHLNGRGKAEQKLWEKEGKELKELTEKMLNEGRELKELNKRMLNELKRCKDCNEECKAKICCTNNNETARWCGCPRTTPNELPKLWGKNI